MEDSGIIIKPEDLIAAANVLRESSKMVQTAIDEVDQQIQALGPTRFQGVSADTIRGKYAKMRDQFYGFKPFIDQFANKMDSIAVDFKAVDQNLGN